MRKRLTPAQAFEQHLLTELPGLSADHIGPLANVWHEAAQHPHIAGQFTPVEKAQRFADRVQADRAAGRPYALALHAAGLDDLGRVDAAVLQAEIAWAAACRFPWYVRLRLPGSVCRFLTRWQKPDPGLTARLQAAVQELCPAGWSHPRGTCCPGCGGPADVLTPRPPGHQ
ncbi:hypothetical protein [Streptomyces sp. NPDC018036]|uniref:hypothetical protein n=1 Tax=Streptomyces sp. NPDC018036 TaxID=3365035 RepID=UPI0037B96996